MKHDWSQPVPLSFRAGVWLSVIVVAALFVWAATTETTVYISEPGVWQGSARGTFLTQDEFGRARAGTPAYVSWDSPYTGSVPGKVAMLDDESRQAIRLDVGPGFPPPPVGATGTAYFSAGKQKVLNAIWDWLSGTP